MLLLLDIPVYWSLSAWFLKLFNYVVLSECFISMFIFTFNNLKVASALMELFSIYVSRKGLFGRENFRTKRLASGDNLLNCSFFDVF